MLTSQEIDNVQNILSQLRFKIDTESFTFDGANKPYECIEKSLLINGYTDIEYYDFFKIKNCKDDAHLLIFQVHFKIRSGKYNTEISELQLIGFKKMVKNFGHILIRPETIEDKVSEFFKRTEIDFKDYPEFSSKYFFLSEEEAFAHSFATSNRLQLIEKQNEISIEVIDDILIAKFPRVLNFDDCNTMIDFIKAI